jgi:hypothetical protein
VINAKASNQITIDDLRIAMKDRRLSYKEDYIVEVWRTMHQMRPQLLRLNFEHGRARIRIRPNDQVGQKYVTGGKR